MTVRVVFADDNYLVREGVAGLLTETAGSTSSRRWPTPTRCPAPSPRTGPTRCSPTSGCRRRSPPRASTRPSGSGPSTPRPGWWCSPSTSRRTTPSTCSPTGWRGSATSSRSGSPRSTTWSVRLQDVARGGSALDPKVVEGLMDRKNQETSSALQGLTERELEVLQELATGRSNAAVGEDAVHERAGGGEARRLGLQKLGLVHESEVNRRVMAVLAFLEATGGAGAPSDGGGNPTPACGQPPVPRSAGRETMDVEEVCRARCPCPDRRRPGAVPPRDGGRGRRDRRVRGRAASPPPARSR